MIGPRGHPLHPVIAIAPLALLGAGVASDIAALVTHDPDWADAARWALGASFVSGVVVALPGIADTLGYPSASRGVPIRHGILNGVVMVLVAVSWWLRAPGAAPHAGHSIAALLTSSAGAVVAIVAWRIGRRLTR